MKLIFSLFLFAIVPFANSQDQLSDQERGKKWAEYATPSANHALLKEMVGTWSTTTTWQSTPTAKSFTFKGKSTNKLIMGGRFLERTSKSESLGGEFEDRTFLGYNNLEKRFESFGLNNKGTGMSFGFGEYDPATKTLTTRGTLTNYAFKKNETEYRSEIRFIDKNTIQYSLYYEGVDQGKDFKSVEMTSKRQK